MRYGVYFAMAERRTLRDRMRSYGEEKKIAKNGQTRLDVHTSGLDQLSCRGSSKNLSNEGGSTTGDARTENGEFIIEKFCFSLFCERKEGKEERTKSILGYVSGGLAAKI